MTTGSNEWKGVALSHGRYVVTDRLGEGGMGYVYRARDRNLDTDVVIKVPRQSMMEDPDFAGRFARETRSLVALSHPGIVKVTDVGDWDGLPFAVMQYLPGGSLEDRLASATGDRAGPDGPARGTTWLPGVAAALDFVHAQGYIHRDVKPGNILFDAQGHSFLSDFGVAKVMAVSGDANAKSSRTAMTGAGMVLGTPEYMAPELIMGEPFDGRVDQYALAVTVYETLCGRRPFEDDSKTKVLVLHTTKAPPGLIEHRPEIGERLNEAVLKGLAKDPGDRYPNCAAMAAAITAAARADRAVRDDRVRIKCGACGRSLTVLSTEFAKLAQAGKQVACPACKAPISLAHDTGTSTRTQPPRRSGTVVMSTQTPTSTPAPAHDPSRTPGPQRRPAATLVERRPASTVVMTPDSTAAEQGLGGPPGSEPAAKTNSMNTWLIVGASALASLVILAVLMRGMGGSGSSATLATTTAPKVGEPALATAPAPVQTAAAPEVKPAPVPPAPAEPPKPAIPPAVAAIAPPRTTAAQPPAQETPSSKVEQVAIRTNGPFPPMPTPPSPNAPGDQPAPDPTPTPSEPDEPAPIVLPPGNKLKKVELDRLVEGPGLYANQHVELARLCCLAGTSTVRPDGTVVVPVIESDLHLQAAGSMQVRRANRAELELDRELASRLASAGMLRLSSASASSEPAWSNDLAIVTLKVARRTGGSKSWVPTVVKLEFLTKYLPEVAKSGYKKKLRITYKTRTITPDGERSGEGNAQEWSLTNRLSHVNVQFQKLFDKQSHLQSQAQWNQFGAQLEAAAAQSVRSAASASAAYAAEQRRLMQQGR